MSSPTAVGVDDDPAVGEAGVAVWSRIKFARVSPTGVGGDEVKLGGHAQRGARKARGVFCELLQGLENRRPCAGVKPRP